MSAQLQAQQIVARCKEIFKKAEEIYKVDLSKVQISFNLKGRCAGIASATTNRFTGIVSDLKIRFNADMLTREAFDHLLNNTVPHEAAHLVCFINPALGRNHDSGWEHVCVTLGGSGATRHKEEVVYGKGYTYEYTTDTGVKVRVSERHHRAVESGLPLRYRKGKGTVTKGCAYSIVGYQGRTLTTPIVKQATATSVPAPASVGIVAPVPEYRVAAVTRTVSTKPGPGPAVAIGVGESKASISRRIMSTWYAAGKTYEEIIAEMMRVNGYDRQLARGTFKANAPKIGLPTQY